jgi:NAD(P)-dependent dehydrogenase (short-subunit alcohol dehydrogenase family)
MSNQLVVITGASRGLGLVLAQEFSQAEWQVIGTGRSERPAELPPSVQYKQFNAGEAPATQAFWQQVAQDYAGASVCLVNNAGGYTAGYLIDLQPADFAEQMQSIYFTAVYMTQGLVQHLPAAKIINVVSNSALTPSKTDSAYGSAKAAERHFFQVLHKELDSKQYQVTNLYPSDIATSVPNPKAMHPDDLAAFIREQAENRRSYYLRDITVFPQTL